MKILPESFVEYFGIGFYDFGKKNQNHATIEEKIM